MLGENSMFDRFVLFQFSELVKFAWSLSDPFKHRILYPHIWASDSAF